MRRLDELSERVSDQQRDGNRGHGGELAPADADMTLSDYEDQGAALDEGIPDYFDLDITSPYAVPEETIFGPGSNRCVRWSP